MASKPSVSWWRGAITGPDNKTIDPTFLSVIFAVFVILPAIITAMLGITAYDVVVNHKDYGPGALGGGIAAVLAGVAAFIGTCAALLRQDRRGPDPAGPQQGGVTNVKIDNAAA